MKHFCPTRTACGLLLLLCLLISGAVIEIHAQQPALPASPEMAQGIQHYRQGNYREAVAALKTATKKNKNDAEAWHFLGLALHNQGKIKDARKAFERAISLRPDYAPSRAALAYMLLLTNKTAEAKAEAEQALRYDPQNPEANYIIAELQLREKAYEDAIQRTSEITRLYPEFAAAWLLRSQAVISQFVKARQDKKKTDDGNPGKLAEAAENLGKFLQLSTRKNDPALKLWREQLEGLKLYADLADKNNPARQVFTTDEVTTKPVLIYKEKASYTEAARTHKVVGSVLLAMIVDESGSVRSPLVLQSLPYGMTESAIKAASKMRWKPAEKDGKPVAVVLWYVEFSFNIY
ncbi:MAG: tetratricopeptide repeat protein [Blastocatellia bacterium]